MTERGGALKDTPSDKVSSPYPIEGVEVLIQYIKDQSRPKSVETPRRRQAFTQLRVLGKGTLAKTVFVTPNRRKCCDIQLDYSFTISNFGKFQFLLYAMISIIGDRDFRESYPNSATPDLQ